MSLNWGNHTQVVLCGLSVDKARLIAGRWGAIANPEIGEPDAGVPRLDIDQDALAGPSPEPNRVGISFRPGKNGDSGAIRVGPHAVKLGIGDAPDTLMISDRRPPSAIEWEILVDVAINHLLSRQGNAVLHACAFEYCGVGVVGLGESFSGKTTVAIAAMRAGGSVLSDDLVLATPSATGRISLFPLRTFGWLRGRTREVVPKDLQQKLRETEEAGEPRWVLSRKDGGIGFIGRSEARVLWVLSVDRRLKASRISEIGQGNALAALIRASSPIFLSRHCREERDALIPVLRGLSESCDGFRIRLGRRLLDDPEGEVASLFNASTSHESDSIRVIAR